METNPITTEIKRKIYSWIRGAFLGMVGYSALLVLASGKWDWFWGWVYMLLLTLAVAAQGVVEILNRKE